MTTNADMTIYNYWYNPEIKEYEYRRTQIQGVHWHTNQKVAVSEKGAVSADIYKIRIPKDAEIQDGRTFLTPNLYQKLDKEGVKRHWTVAHDDLFVRGLVELEVTGLSSLKQCPEAGKVSSYSANDFGFCPHIRIGGVA